MNTNDYNENVFTFKKAWLHLKTIMTHKKWVFHYCKMCGITWQGIIHDLSKFSPTEFMANVKYVRPGVSPIDVQKKEVGYAISWFHHKGHNPHHYEYWMDRFDDGCYVTRMPYKYIVECLCDHMSANKAYNGKDATYEMQYKWWMSKRNLISMHPDNIEFLDTMYNRLRDGEKNGTPDYTILSDVKMKQLYNMIIYKSNHDIQMKIKNK